MAELFIVLRPLGYNDKEYDYSAIQCKYYMGLADPKHTSIELYGNEWGTIHRSTRYNYGTPSGRPYEIMGTYRNSCGQYIDQLDLFHWGRNLKLTKYEVL